MGEISNHNSRYENTEIAKGLARRSVLNAGVWGASAFALTYLVSRLKKLISLESHKTNLEIRQAINNAHKLNKNLNDLRIQLDSMVGLRKEILEFLKDPNKYSKNDAASLVKQVMRIGNSPRLSAIRIQNEAIKIEQSLKSIQGTNILDRKSTDDLNNIINDTKKNKEELNNVLMDWEQLVEVFKSATQDSPEVNLEKFEQ